MKEEQEDAEEEVVEWVVADRGGDTADETVLRCC
jgi:hypothetical protein